jgi:fimbrial chaperone protein
VRILNRRTEWLARLCLLGLALVGRAESVHAGTFSVSPTRLFLAPGATSGVLTLANPGDHPVRFQLTAYAWDQLEDGSMRLSDTADIIVYPPLVEVEPGQSRRVRVGTTKPFNAIEQTYRVFIEELPNLERTPDHTLGVQVRTKMGVPVFLGSAAPTVRAAVESVAVADGRLTFRLVNAGTEHVMANKIAVTGLSESGDAVSEQSLSGWYLLAEHSQLFSIPFEPPDCKRVASILLSAEFDGAPRAERRLAVGSRACPVQ